MNKIKKYIKLIIIASNGVVYGQLDHPELTSYIQTGLRQNLLIKKIEAKYTSEIDLIKVKKGLPNPVLNFGYFLESVETAAGPQEYKIGLTQPIPFIGKRSLSGQIQRANSNAIHANLSKQQLNVSHEILSDWLDLYYLNKKLSLTRHIYELIRNWDHIVRAKYITSTSSHPDLIKSQIEIIQLDETIQSLENEIDPLISKFSVLLNDSNMTDVTIPSELRYELMDFDKGNILNQIEQKNPTILKNKYLVEKNQKSVNLAKLSRLPNFGIGVEQIGTNEKEGSPFSGKDPIVVKMSLDIPIWFGKNNSKIKSAVNNLDASHSQLMHEKRNQKSIFESIWFTLSDSRRKIELYRDQLIPKGQEALFVTEKAYRTDQVDYLTLIDSQKRLLKFQLDYEMAVITYFKAVSQLTILTGGLK